MHGPAHSTTFTRILAIDLGKFNSVACIYDPATHAHRFVSAQTTPRTIHDLLVAHQTDDPAQTLLVIETCDVAGWVHDIAVALGIRVAVANPAHEAWRWTRVKRKTDKDDALKLAKLAVLGQLPTAHMPSPQQRQRRRLVHYRRVLVDRRTQIKNQVRSIFSQQGLGLPKRGKAWTLAGIRQIGEEARPLNECESIDDLWRGRLHVELQLLETISTQIEQVDAKLDALGAKDERVRLLRSVPGVGPRLAARGWPRRWWRTWTTRAASRAPARSPATRGWCPNSSRAARSSEAAASPAAGRRCCVRCWLRSRGWCTSATPGPSHSFNASVAGWPHARTSRSSRWPANCWSRCGRCCATTPAGASRR